jgi:hypothetical protein
VLSVAGPVVPAPLAVGVPGQFATMNPGQNNQTLAVLTPTQTSTTNTGTTGTSTAVFGTGAPVQAARVGSGQFSPAQVALAQQAFATENQLAALTRQSPGLTTQALQFINTGAPVRLQDLPFLAGDATGNVNLVPTAPPTQGVAPLQLVAEANGEVPANLAPLGAFNRGLLTARQEILLSGGGGVALGAGPDVQQPAVDRHPAAVQPAPDDEEPQEPPAAGTAVVPDAGPAATGDRVPVILAPPARRSERFPDWEITFRQTPAVVVQRVAAPAARPAVPAAPPTASSEPSAPLWRRFVSAVCFAAGALGAVWCSDVSGLDEAREKFPVLRQKLRRRPA